MVDGGSRPAEVVELGHRERLTSDELEHLDDVVARDPDARARAAALAAASRHASDLGAAAARIWQRGARDPDASVRRRAAEVAPEYGAAGVSVAGDLAHMAETDEPLVAEAAAFALGEVEVAPGSPAIEVLMAAARSHDDALVREASVAALGSLGDGAALSAVLAALSDRPPVRRRAVLALAAFEGPDVEEALRRCLHDRDYQVRQAAEDLLG